MNSILGNIFLLTTIFAVSSALNCTICNGIGTTCVDNVGIRTCPPGGDGRCGRIYYVQNGVQKVVGNCALIGTCNSSIDCNKDGFEFGKRYKNATNCVVSCCDGDNCVPKEPLQCYQCEGEGESCNKSMNCGYEDDRCLKINFKVGGKLMTDARCYQSANCSKDSEICELVKKKYPMAKDCKHTCCKEPNCNDQFISTTISTTIATTISTTISTTNAMTISTNSNISTTNSTTISTTNSTKTTPNDSDKFAGSLLVGFVMLIVTSIVIL